MNELLIELTIMKIGMKVLLIESKTWFLDKVNDKRFHSYRLLGFSKLTEFNKILD